MRHLTTVAVGVGLLMVRPAFADPPPRDTVAPTSEPHDIREEIPLLAYTTSAFGAPGMTMGALGYGGVLGAAPSTSPRNPVPGLRAGGGARIWGSPIDRLTLMVEVSKPLDDQHNATGGYPAKPSVTAMVRIFGGRKQGWALGTALSYRTDSFTELGGELEGSILFSLSRARLHADANVTFGGAVNPDEHQEADGEAKLRVGYDVTPWLRIGADSRFRYRLAGPISLPGNRLGDAVGGPELLFSYKHLFLAMDGGPSTVGVVRGLGASVVGTVGGALW